MTKSVQGKNSKNKMICKKKSPNKEEIRRRLNPEYYSTTKILLNNDIAIKSVSIKSMIILRNQFSIKINSVPIIFWISNH